MNRLIIALIAKIYLLALANHERRQKLLHGYTWKQWIHSLLFLVFGRSHTVEGPGTFHILYEVINNNFTSLGYLVSGATPYDYSATIECLKQPLDPQYGGGLITNPGFAKGTEAWEVDGQVKIEARKSGAEENIESKCGKYGWQENWRSKDQDSMSKTSIAIGWAKTPSSILMSESYQKWFVLSTAAVFDNEMKWYYVEGLQGHENHSIPDAMLKFFEDHGIDVRGHNILWGADTIQRWVKDLPPRQLLSESVRRMGSVMSRYAGKLVAWDVVNENLHHPLFEERLGKNVSYLLQDWTYFLEEIMREAFAHPAVKGMMIWIGWKPDRCNEMCLLNKKLQNSASGDVVDKLLAEWKTTNLRGVTDKEGSFEVKVFHGDYDVTIYNPNNGATSQRKCRSMMTSLKNWIFPDYFQIFIFHIATEDIEEITEMLSMTLLLTTWNGGSNVVVFRRTSRTSLRLFHPSVTPGSALSLSSSSPR
ncbi:hypothetical protein HAX54_036823 [Datura stramonium]|uniref:GH10 domain-containing protein n=1 Tax=Datura stramonium TaxID=4076 RepID=A0ABS8RN61_DATST|nr:hypothetical protein [Datura stramonium]